MTKIANEDANNTDSNMNDLYLIDGFQQMMASNHASERALNDSFFEIIKPIKSDVVWQEYIQLGEKIEQNKLSQSEVVAFVTACSEQACFLADKLSEDITLCSTNKQRVLKFLKDNVSLTGWPMSG
eukprot:gene566-655_t